MAIPTVTISGTIYLADGSAAANCRLSVRLSRPGVVSDGSQDHRVMGAVIVHADASGAVNLELIPNDQISPSGTHYVVDYLADDGTAWRELWDLPNTPNPTEIGDIPAP